MEETFTNGAVAVLTWAVALACPLALYSLCLLGDANGYFKDVGMGGVSVLEYGAKCDGMSDDTSAIQHAINAAIEQKAPLLLPVGTCIMSADSEGSVFKIGSNLSIAGHGANASVLKMRSGTPNFGTIFGPFGARIDNIGFKDFSVDYNTRGNPPDSLKLPRLLIGTTSGSTGMIWDNVAVRDVSSVNVIYSGSSYTEITKCRFELSQSARLYHDHSTIYLAAEHGKITDDVFVGGPNAPGSVTAIEIHGGHQVITRNKISGYLVGMNVTGIAPLPSLDILVAKNTIENAYHGIMLWSKPYRTHADGFGLKSSLITENNIRLSRSTWLIDPAAGGVLPGNPSGITIEPNSSLPIGDLVITKNRIEYDAPPSFHGNINGSSCMGIGYWDASGTNTVSSVVIADNIIVNSPASAIRWAAVTGSVEVRGNTIVNAGSSSDKAMPSSYRAGIMISPVAPISHLSLSRNVIASHVRGGGMTYGLEVLGSSCVLAEGNVVSVDRGAVSRYVGYIYVGSDQCPAVVHGTQRVPRLQKSMLPSHGVALGSSVNDTTTGDTWVYNGATWSATR